PRSVALTVSVQSPLFGAAICGIGAALLTSAELLPAEPPPQPDKAKARAAEPRSRAALAGAGRMTTRISVADRGAQPRLEVRPVGLFQLLAIDEEGRRAGDPVLVRAARADLLKLLKRPIVGEAGIHPRFGKPALPEELI